MQKTSLSPAEFGTKAAEAADLMRALSHAGRLLVLCQLIEGERSVGTLQATAGLSQSALSQHLARLREDGLVATRREAQTIYYRLADDRAARVINTLASIYCPPT